VHALHSRAFHVFLAHGEGRMALEGRSNGPFTKGRQREGDGERFSQIEWRERQFEVVDPALRDLCPRFLHIVASKLRKNEGTTLSTFSPCI